MHQNIHMSKVVQSITHARWHTGNM